MNPAGRYSYSNAATLFTLSDIGVSAHRYHNRLDVFTQSLENGAAQSGIEVQLLNAKGQNPRRKRKATAEGHVTLQTDKEAALLLARKRADHAARPQAAGVGSGGILYRRRARL